MPGPAPGILVSRLRDDDANLSSNIATMHRLLIVLTSLAALLSTGAPAAAQDIRARGWVVEKCARYTKAWTEALARRGTKGLGQEFIARHEAFLASGCTGEHNVCPRSGAELDLANILVIAAMNAGTASTFPPFGCRGS
jgi:hypothetical protein